MTLLLPSLLTLLAATPDAQAADFSGRVRRIRIRDNQDSSNFRTIVQTESGDPTDPGSLDVAMIGLETGDIQSFAGRATQSRMLDTATASLSRARPIETKYTMTAQMRGISDPTLTWDWTAQLDRCLAACPWTEEILDDGTVAGVKLVITEEADGTETATVQLRLVPGDVLEWTRSGAVMLSVGDEDGDGLPDETVTAESGQGPIFRTRWASQSWSTDEDAVQIDATLTNPDGSTDSFSDLAVLDLNGETGLAEATIKVRRKGGYKVNLWTQATADAPVGSVFVEVSDGDSDDVLGELDIDTAIETTAILSATLPPGLVAGEKVATTVSLFEGDAEVLTEAFTLQLNAGLLSATFAEGSHLALSKAAVYLTEDGSYELAFSVTGEDAGLVSHAVVGVTTRTVLGDVDAAIETVWQRWTAVLDTDAAPETFGFDAEVRDDEGGVLDGWVFDIQAQFGTGTRSTAGSANNRAELL